jgi:nicotinamide-nucleotide amidase
MYDQKAIETIKEQLAAQNQTIAVAESVTAGLLQAALASANEASQYFQGGITCYNIGQKCRHLNVDPIHALSCNCVSTKMAEDMARQCCISFTSDWAIAITGYASPMPDSHDKLFAYYAIVFRGKVMHSQRVDTGQQTPMEAQLFYVDQMLQTMQKLALDNAEGEACDVP